MIRAGGANRPVFSDRGIEQHDDIGQLKTARGSEPGGGVARLNEQFGYAYDAAWNLNRRTNNALVQSFGVNNLNDRKTKTRSGSLTLTGTTTSAAKNVTVNALTATRYADATFAKGGFPLVDGTTNVANATVGGNVTQLEMTVSG